MKKIKVFILSALVALFSLAAGSAFAVLDDNSTNQYQGQGQIQGQVQGQGQAQFANVDVSNRISTDVRANAMSFAGAASQSKSNANSNSGGNSQSVTVTDSGQMNYSGKYEVRSVPSVFSGNVYPTAPCMGSSTVGGAGVGFGFSVGSSWKDDECGKRETARSFNSMGLKEDALAILCSSEYAAVAPSCQKPVAKEN